MDEMDRKLAIKHFLECKGYSIFKEELDGLSDSFTNELDKMLANPINPQELGTFNFNTGLNAGLKRVLYVLEAMKEELESNIA
jgi:hypothetical protein